MRLTVYAILVIGIVAFLLSAGCTDILAKKQVGDFGSADKTTVSTTVPAGTGSTAGSNPSSLNRARPAPGSVTAVDFSKLIPLLPEAPAGWEASDPEGAKMTFDQNQWSFASRDYSKGDASASVMISDSAFYNVGGWEMWNNQYSIETTDGYVKTTTVRGFPAWEMYSKPSDYAMHIGINDRFMVFIEVKDGSKSDLDTFVNAVPFSNVAGIS